MTAACLGSDDVRDTLAARTHDRRAAWLPPDIPPPGAPLRTDTDLLLVCSDLAEHSDYPYLRAPAEPAQIIVRYGPLLERLDGLARARLHLTCTRGRRTDTDAVRWNVLLCEHTSTSTAASPYMNTLRVAADLDAALDSFNQAARKLHREHEPGGPRGQARWLSVDHEPDLNVVVDNLDRSEVRMALARLPRRDGADPDRPRERGYNPGLTCPGRPLTSRS